MKVGDPTNKVADAIPDKGEASSEKAPSSSGKNGTGIFAHVEPPLVYGGPVPSTHLNHAGPPPKIVKNEDFDSWVYRFKRHLNHVNTNIWRIIEEGFCRCQNRWIAGRGSRTVRLGSMVTGGRGHEVLPRFGPS